MKITSLLKSWPLRKFLILIWHALGVYLTYYLSFVIRFDNKIDDHIHHFQQTLPILLAVTLLTFFLFKQFSGLWRYYSIDDLLKTIVASLVSVSVFFIIIWYDLIGLNANISRSVILAEVILLTGWCTGSRAWIRFVREKRRKWILNRKEFGQRVLVCGSITEADLLIRGCSNNFEGVFCAIVSNESEFNSRAIHGTKIYIRDLDDVGFLVGQEDITDIHILAPFNKPESTNKIIDSCAKASVSPKFHTIPSLKELASGELLTSVIRNVEVTDLLGRVVTDLPREKNLEFLKGKKVLITGAGGSIGSELCRQLLTYKPNVLVLFEFSEVSLYKIDKELHELVNQKSYKTQIIPFAGDIRHKEEFTQAAELVNGIDIVYHAAAYKHVPLMEANIAAAFRNNVLGTARLAEAAEECNVKKFVMISSDKAVRPSNVMGATKRIAERIIQERKQQNTEFVSVRFGNVLGSSGSVIPLFKKQIHQGKPVTVTTKNMQRYFMTIPEAVDLVLMAGTVGRPSQIMVLEMGEPVRIYDLAVRLIELSGLTPHKDVKIEFCGLRPGEKEYEEILTEDENVVKTDLDRIWLMEKDDSRQKGKSVSLELIEAMVTSHDDISLKKLIFDYVPENTFKKSAFTMDAKSDAGFDIEVNEF